MTAHLEPTELGLELLKRLRLGLTWLVEDGFVETDAHVARSAVTLAYRSGGTRVSIGLNPGMSEIDIRIRRPGQSGNGFEMQRYLAARGLTTPSARIDATSPAAVDLAVDQHVSALKLLRDHELAGQWSELHRDMSYLERREQLIDGIVERSKPNSDP